MGVIAERRRIDHPWADYSWRPVALVPGLGAAGDRALPQQTESGDDWDRFLIGRLPIVLHRKETEAYLQNLSAAGPAIYVVLERCDDGSAPRPKRATASPFEAQDYLDSGDDSVEALPIPEALEAWIAAFVETHHETQVFKKRKREKLRDDAPLFGKELHPIEARFYKGKGAKTPK
ncbi:MAG TPA: DUF3305 domain-containing protein [Kiloniellaceae bacterium]|nr:DUF3305 domain-containing protein [Kiloniellaceae bacterium]